MSESVKKFKSQYLGGVLLGIGSMTLHPNANSPFPSILIFRGLIKNLPPRGGGTLRKDALIALERSSARMTVPFGPW